MLSNITLTSGLNSGEYYKDTPHVTAGIGLKLVMNENFVMSADIGKALKEQDGNMEFYIGLNYLF